MLAAEKILADRTTEQIYLRKRKIEINDFIVLRCAEYVGKATK